MKPLKSIIKPLLFIGLCSLTWTAYADPDLSADIQYKAGLPANISAKGTLDLSFESATYQGVTFPYALIGGHYRGSSLKQGDFALSDLYGDPPVTYLGKDSIQNPANPIIAILLAPANAVPQSVLAAATSDGKNCNIMLAMVTSANNAMLFVFPNTTLPNVTVSPNNGGTDLIGYGFLIQAVGVGAPLTLLVTPVQNGSCPAKIHLDID